MNLKAHPFIDTMLNEEYRVFVQQPFTVELFLNSFYGWSGKDLAGWQKYTSVYDKTTIEFFGEKVTYKINNPKLVGDKIFSFPYPKNLDQFICDCQRCLVDLRWNDALTLPLDMKYYMKQDELKKYFDDLLIKLEKE